MAALRIEQVDAQAILDYLTRRPWREVNGFVLTLAGLKPVEEPAPAAAPAASAGAPEEVKGEPV
jgi:hypothetical protein